ncbi:hypothetical protein ACIGZJ_17425 [Kitasatospora sp. NPDC052868]|uniref:hypothetical protein n=1 Tax=Kitasatospora sp. NPDC052868 TaxID=3364060 RepID=UPI0037C9630E
MTRARAVRRTLAEAGPDAYLPGLAMALDNLSTDLGGASRLVARREAEPLLGHAPGSLKAVMQQQRGRRPEPLACRRHDRALPWDTGRPVHG